MIAGGALMDTVLHRYFQKNMKTVELLDEFAEKDDKDEYKYYELYLDNVYSLFYKNTFYYVGLMIRDKFAEDKNVIKTDMTFTWLKKNIGKKLFRTETKYDMELIDNSLKIIAENVDKMTTQETVFFEFEKPIVLNAQNSGNRCGYGWEYSGDMCVYEGTEYGETSEYLIYGFYLTKFFNVAHRFKISGVTTYYGFKKAVKEYDISEEEQEILKQKYKHIEQEYIEIDGDEVIWSHRITPKEDKHREWRY